MTKDKYVLGKRSGNKQIVFHSYDYNGHTIVYRASVPYKEGAPKSYYVGLVDKEMAKLKAKGKLKKYNEAYIRKMVWLTRRKKVAIGVTVGALVVIGVTVGVLVGYYSQFTYDNVLFSSKTLNIDRTNVLLNNDANFTFTVNDFYAKYDYSLPDKVDEVSINGVKLTDEQYDYSEGHLKIEAKYVTGKIYIAAEAEAVDFASDSWTNIIKTANEGLASLHFRYGVDSLVGYEHSITFNTTFNLKVRVIGEGHDRLVKDDDVPSNKAAALTFELVELVPDEAQSYSILGEEKYSDSYLKFYCDGFGEEEGIAKYFPAEVADNIKTVSKKTVTSEGSTEYDYLKVFPLSYREISGVSYNGNQEESCYQYYADPYVDSLTAKRKKISSYWLRSPSGTDAYYVDTDGNISTDTQTNTNRVSVAFAIGETESFITDDWSTVTEKANNGVKALQEYYGVDSFLGLEREVELKNDAGHLESQTARVRVIGEKHDRLANSDNLASALTFEFIDSDYVTSYGAPSYELAYSTSQFRVDNSLSNQLYNRLPDDLKSSVQKVIKKTTLFSMSEFETTEDYLFPLSLKESGDIYYSLAEPYNHEEETYQLFRLDIDPTDIWKDINAIDELRKHSINNSGVKYWLRSPHCLGSYSAAHNVDIDGSVMNLKPGETELHPHTTPTYIGLPYFPAFNIGIDDIQVTFANDSWDNVCYYAERGLDALKEAYGLRSFIGQQREVTLEDGTVYSIRVIGENEDETVSGNKAALTFEFTTLFNDGKLFEYVPEEDIVPKWSESPLRTYCNNDVFSLLPTSLKEAVKEVTKKTVVWNAEDSYSVETTTDKVFLLSVNETMPGNEAEDYVKYGFASPEQIAMYKQENAHYSYYISATDIIRYKSANYWLRSPCLTKWTKIVPAHIVRGDGVYGDGWIDVNGIKGTEWFGIAPVFAI